MDAKGFVIPSGGGSVLSWAPGRSAALKLLGRDTGDSIMLFEETAPAGTETTFHLHRDSDEVAYVLSGEMTFKIGDEVTVGGPGHLCLLAARRTACVEKHRHRNRLRAVSQYPGRCRRLFRGTAGPARPGRRMDPKPTKCGAGTAGRSSVRRLFDIRFSQKLSGASDGLRGMNCCGYAGLLTPAPLTSFGILLAPRIAS
jgi:mannose-6-phosphate isomerase-like protein (cupin superfamily)